LRISLWLVLMLFFFSGSPPEPLLRFPFLLRRRLFLFWCLFCPAIVFSFPPHDLPPTALFFNQIRQGLRSLALGQGNFFFLEFMLWVLGFGFLLTFFKERPKHLSLSLYFCSRPPSFRPHRCWPGVVPHVFPVSPGPPAFFPFEEFPSHL